MPAKKKNRIFGQNLHDAYDAIVGQTGEEKKEMAHEHSECQHKIKYCVKCDLTYCTECLREWGTCRLNHEYQWKPITITYPWVNPWTTTTASTDTYNDTSPSTIQVFSEHVHN